MKIIPNTRPWFPKKMREEIIQDINYVMSSGKLMLGKYANLIEKEYSKITSANYSISITSATAGLQIALKYIDIAGGEVLVPAASFITDVSSIQMEGGTPVLVDINPDTLTFDIEDLKKKLTQRTRAIIWVHLTGYIGSEYQKIQSFARENGLFLIEDAAHAHGARIDGKVAGSLGDVGIFSFYPTKVITAGTGGILTTNDKKLSDFARDIRLFGTNQITGEVSLQGSDWFLDEFRSSVGYRQTSYLLENLKRRREIAKIYLERLESSREFKCLNISKDNLPSWFQFPVFCHPELNANKLRNILTKNGVECKPIYPPIHKEVLFRSLSQEGLKNSEETLERSICLPMYVNLTNSEIDIVIERLFQAIDQQ
tara:strand:+ start:13402 stop:14511 length:1110 start_codon:yes stop_codon:yes gene_type:complete